MNRYARSPDGTEFVIANGSAEWVLRLSVNEAEVLFDALVIFRAERHGQIIPDEPALITGDA